MIKQIDDDMPFSIKDKGQVAAYECKRKGICINCAHVKPLCHKNPVLDWCDIYYDVEAGADGKYEDRLIFFYINRDEPPKDVCPHFVPRSELPPLTKEDKKELELYAQKRRGICRMCKNIKPVDENDPYEYWCKKLNNMKDSKVDRLEYFYRNRAKPPREACQYFEPFEYPDLDAFD